MIKALSSDGVFVFDGGDNNRTGADLSDKRDPRSFFAGTMSSGTEFFQIIAAKLRDS
ncbi:hypothetical protein [Succinimonas sp.]|uniref:hypothetical protein n=1 Tax=Succinimonas sp. TaxID=1936151 RepID=UPI003870360D